MKTTSVTVVIPTYNGVTRGYLFEAIDSVLAQTALPKRFLVVDDGSTDGSAEAIRTRYPDLEVVSKPNGGLPHTRNFALELIETDYICYLDDDDIWEPQKLERQMSYLQRHPEVGLLFCGVTFIDQHGRKIGQKAPTPFGHSFPEILLGNNILPPSTVVFSVALIRKAGLFDDSLRQGEDYEYFIRCAREGKIAFVPDLLVRYRQHGSQMSGSYAFIDEATYNIIDRHAQASIPEKRQDILRYYCYGAACRALMRGDLRHMLASIDKAGGFRLFSFVVRLVGVLLSPFPRLKSAWRQVEQRMVVG